MPEPDEATLLAGRLAAARLPAHEDEIAHIIDSYQLRRSAVDALYEIPDVKYEAPALTLTVVPPGIPDADLRRRI